MDSDGYLSQLAEIFNGITVNTPSISAIIAIVLAGVLLLASGFASASEIAFFSLSPSDLNDIDEHNHPADEKISALLGDSERLLATILITNNFVNVTIILHECIRVSFSLGGVHYTDCNPDFPVIVVRRDHAEDLFSTKDIGILPFLRSGHLFSGKTVSSGCFYAGAFYHFSE